MNITEAVECCPYCEFESSYPNYCVEESGYVVKCKNCGREMFLCDECVHADDNKEMKCDWHIVGVKNGIITGACFRGVTHNKADEWEVEHYEG